MSRPSNPFFIGLYQLWVIPDDDSDRDLELLGAYDDLAQAMIAKDAAQRGITDDSLLEITKRVDVQTHYQDATISVAGSVQNRQQ